VEPELRRFISDTYTGVLYRQGLALLYRDHGVQMRFKDESRGQYRTDEEIKQLEQELLAQSRKLSEELVDELESRGFHTPGDFEENKSELKAIVEGYVKRLMQKL
jgi:hypothetical protein